MVLVPLFDPVDPSTAQARRWLQHELSRGEYVQGDSLVRRLAHWLGDLLGRVLVSPVGGGWVSLLFWTVLLVLLVALLVWAVPQVRRQRRVRATRRDVLDEPGLTAHDYRARAAEALAAGRHDDALLDSFRAIVAGASERTLLDGAPARTAHEIGITLGPAFPDRAEALTGAADRFDAVRYGGGHATRAAAEAMAELDRRLAGTRPAAHPGGLPVPVP